MSATRTRSPGIAYATQLRRNGGLLMKLVRMLVSITLLLSAAAAHAAFYAIGKDGLYVVDEATGKGAFTGFVPLSATTLSHGPAGLLLVDGAPLPGTGLVPLDRGSGMPMAPIVPVAGAGALLGTPGGLTALAAGPTGVQYGAFRTAAGTYIVVVSLSAGTATPVAAGPPLALGPSGTIRGLAYSPATGMLAVVHDPAAPAPADLRSVGLATGLLGAPVAIKVGGSNVAEVAGIAFDPAGVLHALVGTGGGATVKKADLLTIVPATGAGAVIGNTGIPLPKGLATPFGLFGVDATPVVPVVDVNPALGLPAFPPAPGLELVPGSPSIPALLVPGITDAEWVPSGGASGTLVVVDTGGPVGGGQGISVFDPDTYTLLSTAPLSVSGWLPPGGFLEAIESGPGGVLYGVLSLPPGAFPLIPPPGVATALVTVDSASGVMTPVVPLPPPPPPAPLGPGSALLAFGSPIFSLALDPATGLLLGLAEPPLPSGNVLVKIDPATGDISGAPFAPAPPVPVAALASPFLPLPAGGPLVGLITIEFSAEGVLYASAGPAGYGILPGPAFVPGGNPIFAVSATTGAATFLGDTVPAPYGAITSGLRPAFTPPDSDGDGLTDVEETFRGTNLLLPESDGDGLKDGDEIAIYGTDPADADSDNDGFNDGAEVAAGSDPNNAASTPPPSVAVPLMSPALLALLAVLMAGTALLRGKTRGA